MKDKIIISKLTLDCEQQGLNPDSYENLITKILKLKHEQPKYSHLCIRATWEVRNLLTHSIGWPKPSLEEYNMLFKYIFGAICFALHGLYNSVTKE